MIDLEKFSLISIFLLLNRKFMYDSFKWQSKAEKGESSKIDLLKSGADSKYYIDKSIYLTKYFEDLSQIKCSWFLFSNWITPRNRLSLCVTFIYRIMFHGLQIYMEYHENYFGKIIFRLRDISNIFIHFQTFIQNF